ncbi:MAG TPA: hypothetical protein VGM73_13810 [Candidatus Didemnitutus sp.]|jgi:hypothetical protein
MKAVLPLRRTIAVTALGFAWLCATGLFWDGVQAVAWGRMFAGYARTESVTVALADTFDASRPCELCRAVGAARDTARHELPNPSNSDRSAPRVLFLAENSLCLMPAVAPAAWPAESTRLLRARTDEVPVPPPRA